MQVERIAVIILAAGQSSRFGSPKMDFHLESGKTILNTCIEKYQAQISNVSVVVSDENQSHKELRSLGVNLVVSKDSIKGMSQSLIAGVRSQPKADAWVIALGDMPYLKVETILKLVGKATVDNIVVPMHGIKRGNPVIFGGDFYQQLMNLKGDVGAKQLIEENSFSVVKVAVDDQGVLLDIDQPKDLRYK